MLALPHSAVATSPLYAASLHGDAVAVGMLLDAGADPNEESPGNDEGTPLCAASAWGNSEVVAALLAGGADPNEREDRGTGTSPLLWASRNGHAATAQLLLEAGADPDLAVHGVPPLCAAAERGSLAIAALLLEHGADPKRPDAAGRSALRIAEEWSARDVEAELRHWIAPGQGEEVCCHRTARPDGTELVAVEVRSADGGRRIEKETGHRRIADLLPTLRPD